MSAPLPDPQARTTARKQLFLSAVLFGLLAVLARLAARGPSGFTAGQLSVVRFAIGALFSLALFRLRPGTFRPVKYGLLATRGLLGGLAVILYFIALARIPAGEATLLNNIFPVFATVISFFTLGERPTFHLAIALVITTLGVVLVLGGGTFQLSLSWGEIAGILSAVLGAGAVTAIRALRPTDNAPTIFFAFCLGGLAVSIPFAAGPWPSAPNLWWVAFAAGLVSIAAQMLMTHTLGFLTVPEAAIWQQLTPVMSYLWALLVLDERVSAGAAAGVLLVVAGVVWGAALGHRSARAPAVDEPIQEAPAEQRRRVAGGSR